MKKNIFFSKNIFEAEECMEHQEILRATLFDVYLDSHFPSSTVILIQREEVVEALSVSVEIAHVNS